MIRSLKREKGGWVARSQLGVDVFAESAASAVAWADVADSLYLGTPVGLREAFRAWTCASLTRRRNASYRFRGG